MECMSCVAGLWRSHGGGGKEGVVILHLHGCLLRLAHHQPHNIMFDYHNFHASIDTVCMVLVSNPAVAPETRGQTRHRATKGLVPPRLFVRFVCLNM